MGLLSADQAAEVEQLSSQYPAIKKELEAIEQALERYASAFAQDAPPHIEQQIMQQIRQEKEEPKADPPSKPGSWNLLFLGLGVLTMAVAASYFYTQAQQNSRAASELETKYQQLQANCDEIHQHHGQCYQQIAVLRAPSTRNVALKGTKLSPQSSAVVHWNGQQQKALLDIFQLPTPPNNKQYQLWAIVEGQPVDMGLLEWQGEGPELLEVPFIAKPQAFAITLEDKGGKATPNLQQLYIIGEIT
ncbi:MAG: anti-sigma factor [Bacteroidota bacterium]